MLEMSVALGAMEHIKNAKPEEILINLGVLPETLDLVTGTKPWKANNRVEVMRCMDALNHGVCDINGIPRIALPVEYIAASIASFVHPVNVFVACQWSEIKGGAKEMSGSNQKSVKQEEISASQLLSLVLSLQEPNGKNYLNAQFNKRVEECIEEYMNKPEIGV